MSLWWLTLSRSEYQDKLKNFLATEYEISASAMYTKANEAEWNYETDINNKEKEDILLNVTLESAALAKKYWQDYFKDLNPDDYQDEQLKRQVKNLRILGNAALNEEKLTKLTKATNNMINIYNGLSLGPGIEEILAKSTNYDELVYAWKAWRDAKIRSLYQTYVELSNEAAVANKFKDKGELWWDSYESPTFIQDIDDLWTQVEPLNAKLHKYVGRKLKERFGSKLDISDGLIPANVLGNMWAQEWNNIAELVRPFPQASKVDVDAALKQQKYSVVDMFKTSDEFYNSMGLIPMGVWDNTSAGAMIEKPTDGREVLCHDSAWDFCDGHNYRIKMCTNINFEDFIVIHHEMGHIQYFMQYVKQLRWDVFSGRVTQDQWNSHWWEYRKKYQKVKPPVERSENDFDPGAKFHAAGDSQYIAYFVAHILQFQFYKSLCVVAGEYSPDSKEVPLHKCDFYESKAAGDLLSKGLALGASKHWSDALELMTGSRKLDATPLLEYFNPLYTYLKEQNSKY
ncbi:hypothetical protein Zmor_027585 [Zophobas morio]|uniref:Angiotensin-converting enzyme n=1 Tax=Zophobas morio TaxID=2755281 RepID=A0AA38M3H2_9CUCU|nr:hypothetical protein Zmor_027585 [Zophobas morio]